jgi:hypothetical protein
MKNSEKITCIIVVIFLVFVSVSFCVVMAYAQGDHTPPDYGALLGTWLNVIPRETTIAQIEILETPGGAPTVDIWEWGDCGRPLCVWEVIDLKLYAESVEGEKAIVFTGLYYPMSSDEIWAHKIVTGRLRGSILKVSVYTEFMDTSSRYNYLLENIFAKVNDRFPD